MMARGRGKMILVNLLNRISPPTRPTHIEISNLFAPWKQVILLGDLSCFAHENKLFS